MKTIFKILMLLSFVTKSQNINLLPDPGFEDTVICAIQYTYDNLRYWYDPTNSGPDAVLYCVDNVYASDIIKKRSGHVRAVFFLYWVPNPPTEQRDYVASPLRQTLIANKNIA